jgi:DNA-binding FadR family transcriptional regulator
MLARPSLTGQIAADLGLKIVCGRLAEGEILPTEAALGVALGVSRTGIREAVKILASKGLVEVRRKTGTRVRPRRDWNALDPDVLAWQFSGEPSLALLELLELRKIIEPGCAALAAEQATVENLTEIKKSLLAMKAAVGRTSASVEADLGFHLAILEATHNAFMRPFGALIQAALRASFTLTNANSAAYRASLVRHEAVFIAIESRKADAAQAAMSAMLHWTQADIEDAMSRTARRSTKNRLQVKSSRPRRQAVKK